MTTDLELCVKHLQALVGFNTSNPPKKIQSSGLLDYLNSLSYLNPQVTDLGDGSFNILLIKGDPEYMFNVHLDTVPPGEGWTQILTSCLLLMKKLLDLGRVTSKAQQLAY